MDKKPIKFQVTIAMCVLAGQEKVHKRFLFLHWHLDFQPAPHHEWDPYHWRHHPAVKAKVSKASPPPSLKGVFFLQGQMHHPLILIPLHPFFRYHSYFEEKSKVYQQLV